MKAKAYARTDLGLVRSQNEDAFLLDEELGLFVVCDGLGGHLAGEIASNRACEVVRDEIRLIFPRIAEHSPEERMAEAADYLRVAIRTACGTIYREGEKDKSLRGMASTIVALWIIDEMAIVAHVGDSRLYMIRENQAHLMTEDHSLVLEQLRSGLITREEAARSRFSSVVTRALGLAEDIIVDVLEIELVGGDGFVLCSDGLSDYVATVEVHKLFEITPLQEMPDRLVDLANTRGGADNITVIAVGIFADKQGSPGVERKIDALHRIPLFRHLGYKDLIKVLNVVHLHSYTPGEVIIKEGSSSDELFILLEGEAEVRKAGQRLAELESQSFFGEMGMIDNAPRSADVVAISPVSLLTIHREDFYRLLRSDAHLAVKVLSAFCQVLNDRLRKTSDELSGMKRQMLQSFTQIADHWFVDDPARLADEINDLSDFPVLTEDDDPESN